MISKAEIDYMAFHYEKDDLGVTLFTNHLETGLRIIIPVHKSQITHLVSESPFIKGLKHRFVNFEI